MAKSKFDNTILNSFKTLNIHVVWFVVYKLSIIANSKKLVYFQFMKNI